MDSKKYHLGMYEKAFPKQLSWEEKLKACRESGFDWIEISIDESEEKIQRLFWNKKERDKLISAIRDTGTPIWTMCFSCCRKYSLGTLDPEKKPRVMELIERAINFASDIGIRIIQMAGYDVYYEQSSEETKRQFVRNLRIAAELASKRGVMLAFETQMDSSHMDTVEKIMEYVRLIDSPYVNAYPDIGNLYLSKIKYDWRNITEDLETGRGHIVAAHLKETLPGKDRNVPFGTGVTDYENAIEKLKELGVRMFNGEFWMMNESTWFEDCCISSKFLRRELDKVFDK